MNTKLGDTKMAGICWAKYWRRVSYTEEDLQRYAEGSSKSVAATDVCIQERPWKDPPPPRGAGRTIFGAQSHRCVL
jgi:hypothetical protein